MQVFYVNVGGGEPTVRPDFWELLDYAIARDVGVKFSTNGVRIGRPEARRLAATDYVDVQVSLDGADAGINDAVRGAGSYDMAIRALDALASEGFQNPKISVVVTRHNVSQLDEFKALAASYGATLRLTRLRPVRPRRRHLGRAAPDRRAAARAVPLAAGRRRIGADRRQLLPPLGARGVAARA